MADSRATGYQPAFRLAWLGPRHWPLWLGLALMALVALLPRRLRWGLAGLTARWLARRKPKRQFIVDQNLSLAFPDWSPYERNAVALRGYRIMAQCSMDYALFWWAPQRWLRRRIRLEGWEHVEAALERGQPVVFLTGHSLALEAAGVAITQRIPATGLIRHMEHPIIDWLIARGRTRFQGKVYHRESGLRPILRDLRNGIAFYYLPDEDLGRRAGTDWVFAPFFGVPKATLTSLGRIAGRAGAATIPCMAYYDDRDHCYRVRFEPALDDFPSRDATADATVMNSMLERLVAIDPAQYMWTHRLYRTRPPGAPKRYAYKRHKMEN